MLYGIDFSDRIPDHLKGKCTVLKMMDGYRILSTINDEDLEFNIYMVKHGFYNCISLEMMSDMFSPVKLICPDCLTSDGQFLNVNRNDSLENKELTRKKIINVLSNGDRHHIHTHGVADSIEQIENYYAKFINSPDIKIAIGLQFVYKENQEPQGGWRWHKWGPYIGNMKPQCEYIADEPDIDTVICFQLYVVENKD